VLNRQPQGGRRTIIPIWRAFARASRQSEREIVVLGSDQVRQTKAVGGCLAAYCCQHAERIELHVSMKRDSPLLDLPLQACRRAAGLLDGKTDNPGKRVLGFQVQLTHPKVEVKILPF
jgi:hypothetical protein